MEKKEIIYEEQNMFFHKNISLLYFGCHKNVLAVHRPTPDNKMTLTINVGVKF